MMTSKRRKFVLAFQGDATKAAEAAGYTGNRASLQATASRLMADPEIKAAIREREKEEMSKAIATRQERQAMWTTTMRDAQQEMNVRLKASELLGKSEADFIDRQRHEGHDGGALFEGMTLVRGGKQK